MIWLVLLIIEILIESIATALMPVTEGNFINSLNKLDPIHVIYLNLALYFIMRFVYYICQAFKDYCVILYSQYLREKKTNNLIINNQTVDNIPQRIQEDIKLMYFNQVTVYTEYVISAIIFVALLIINYQHKFLVLSALAYGIISLGIAYMFNAKMKYAEKIVQKSEADFRSNLSEYLSGIPFSFGSVLFSNIQAANIRLGYKLFTKLQGGLIILLPYLLLLPSFLAKEISMGDMVQQALVFGLLVVNFDIAISMFPYLTQGRASEERVKELT